MKNMNLNDLAKHISQLEGKKKSLNVAQIKEVIHVLGKIFNEVGIVESVKLFLKIRKAGK
jgi:hypothetical protein